MKKKHLKIAIAALLVVACVGALFGFAAACEKEKQEAVITAETVQEFVYDGQVHNVVATLNHDETQLVYDPQQGYTEIGSYAITVSAPATENYNAAMPVLVTLKILDPSDVALEDLGNKLAASSNFNTAEPIGVDMGVNLSYDPKAEGAAGWDYSLSLKGTLNLGESEETIFGITLQDNVKKAAVFAVTYDGAGNAIYLAVGEDKYKIENADILEALVTTAPNTDVTLGTYLNMIVGMLGSNCTAVDANTYTLDFNLKNTLNGTLGQLISSLLPSLIGEDAVNAIYGLLGASDWSSLVAKLPDLSGKIEVAFNEDGSIKNVSFKDVAYKMDKEEGVAQASISPFTISNSAVSAAIPENAAEYTATKLLNFTLNGSITLANDKEVTEGGVTSTVAAPYIKYNVSILSDLDLVNILKGDYANAGKFYLRISHICDDTCGAYCAAKYSAAEGSLVEIAYDSSVNDTAVYIAAALKSIVGEDALVSLGVSGGLASLASMAIPEYTAITADLTTLLGGVTATPIPSEEESDTDPGTDTGTDTGAGSSINIGAILNALTITTEGGLKIGLDVEALLSAFGLDSSVSDIIGGIFGEPITVTAEDGTKSDTTQMGDLTIAIDSLHFFSTELTTEDLNNTMVSVKDESIESTKNWKASLGGSISDSAMTWAYKTNGRDANPRFENEAIDLTKLTIYEAQTMLLNTNVVFDVTAWDGTERVAYGWVMGVSGIDWTLFGVPQQVQLVVSIPQTIANSTLTGALESFVNLYEMLTTNVPATITLAEVTDVQLVMGENFKASYNLLDIVASDYADAKITFTKIVGEKKYPAEIAISNTADVSNYLWTPYGSNYSVYTSINGQKVENGATLAVNPGTVTLTYEAFGQTFTQDITISDPYTAKTMTGTKTEATVNSNFSDDLTFTLTKADGTVDEVYMDASNRWASSAFVSFTEEYSGEDDISVSNSNIKWLVFKSEDPYGESIQTSYFVNIFGNVFEQKVTLKNVETSYKGSVSDPVVDGLTATFTVTVENNVIGYGSGYNGLTIKVENYSTYSYDITVEDNCTVQTSVASIDVANDMQGGKVTFTVTITSNVAGDAKFYIRLYNGEATGANRVVNTYTQKFTFTDPTAQA